LQIADEIHPGTDKGKERQGNGRGKEGFSVKTGGVEKQPNGFNLCPQNKNEPAGRLQPDPDRMKEESGQ